MKYFKNNPYEGEIAFCEAKTDGCWVRWKHEIQPLNKVSVTET